MAQRQFNKFDIVTLTEARGSWKGVIIDATLTVGEFWAYLVHPLNYQDPENSPTVVEEHDIASANTNYPAFEVGERLNLFGLSGKILAINGDQFTVETKTPRRHYTQIRKHFVHKWKLLVSNPNRYQQ